MIEPIVYSTVRSDAPFSLTCAKDVSENAVIFSSTDKNELIAFCQNQFGKTPRDLDPVGLGVEEFIENGK